MGDDLTINSNIMVIDDSLFILEFVQETLQDRYHVQTAQSAEKAYSLLEGYTPDLILLDLEMPKADGYEVLARIKYSPKWRDIPVIFLTGVADRKKEEKALSMGTIDYILKPISTGVLRKRVQIHLELTIYQKRLEKLVDLKTKQLLRTQELVLDVLANVTTFRDYDTGTHIIRTTNYTKLIVEKLLELGHPDYAVDAVYAYNIIKSAKLHDIGKISVPDDVLLKRGKLTPAEFEDIKLHTVFGAQMIDHVINNLEYDINFWVTAKEIIYHHHEWWNGDGYPKRINGKNIPVSARVMAIADVYDALISERPYKPAFTHEEAVDIIKREAGTHFDASLVDIIAGLFPKFKEVAYTFKDG